MGRMIVRGGHHGRMLSGRRGKGAPVIMIIGLGLAILGAIGVFFARSLTSSTPVILKDAIRFYYAGYNNGAIGGGKNLQSDLQRHRHEVNGLVQVRHAALVRRPLVVGRRELPLGEPVGAVVVENESLLSPELLL